MSRINIINGLLFAYSDTTQNMLKPDGTEFSVDELFAALSFNGGTGTDHIMTEPVTTCYIKSSPNSNTESSHITEESLVSYAAMLNGLMAKFNITTSFEVKFCGMDGWMVVSKLSNEDFAVMKLKQLDLEACRDDVWEFLSDLWVFDTEEEEA